jgi:SOS response regulatory protein OraA/RecX
MSDDPQESPQQPPQLDVWGLALRRISIREYGASELKSYLIRKGATPQQAEEVVSQLVADQRVDDRRYARVIARHQAFRDKGPAYVLAKLRQKGLKLSMSEVQSLYQESLPDTKDSELQMAQEVLERRYPHALESQSEKKRAYEGLLRRGFSRDVVSKCLFRKRGSTGGTGDDID